MFVLPAVSAACSILRLCLYSFLLGGKREQIRGLSHLIPPFSQGLNFLIPLLDRIRYVQSLKEIVINVPEQSAVTLGKEQLLCPATFLLLRLGKAGDGVGTSGNGPGSCSQPCCWVILLVLSRDQQYSQLQYSRTQEVLTALLGCSCLFVLG